MAGTNFDITANTAQFLQAMAQANKAFETLKDYAEQSGNSIDQALNNMSETARYQGAAVDELGGKFKGLAANIAGVAGIAWGGMQFLKQMTKVRSEIQNTEASLRVFLGSTAKASSFLSELQDAAFWNVFEFSELSEAANQMLAYGHSSETVIENLQRLSEVASGTGKPLGDIVNLYNRVKSLDKMDTRMLDQFKTMGIDVVQTLADIEGVSTSMIDKSALKFQDLQKALEAQTDEGGMYFGMMMSKMDNVSDKVGALQDKVTTMFNEMGKQTDGVLMKGIDGVTWLVEHWQELADVITVVVGVYGTYKTALLVINSIQKINNAITASGTLFKALMNQATLNLGKSLGLEAVKHGANVVAIQAETKALLAQKAVRMGLIGAIVLGIAAITAALVMLNKDGSSREEKAMAKVNKEYEKFIKNEKEIVDNARNAIRVINDKTASVNELTAAYQALQKIPAFKGKSLAEIQSMSAEEQEKGIRDAEKNSAVDAAKKVLDKTKDDNKNFIESSMRNAGKTEEKMLQSAEIGEAIGGRAQKKFEESIAAAEQYAQTRISTLNDIASVQDKKDNLTEWIKVLEEENKSVKKNTLDYAQNVKQIMLYKKERAELEKKEATTYSVESQVNQAAENLAAAEEEVRKIQSGEKVVDDPAKRIEEQNKIISNAKSQLKELTGFEFKLSGKDYKDVTDEIEKEQIALAKIADQEKDGITPELEQQKKLHQDQLNKLQAEKKIMDESPELTYKFDMSLDDISSERATLQARLDVISQQLSVNPTVELIIEQQKLEEEKKKLENAYKLRTGMTDEAWGEYKARRSALMEEQKLRDSQIKSERQKIEATKQLALEQLKLDNAEYRRTHTGKSDPAYAKKKQNILLQAQLDIENLDKQLDDWLRAKNKETKELEYDFGIKQLEHAIELEKDWNKKLEMQDELREKNLQHIKEEGEEIKKNELGAYTDADLFSAYTNYRNADNSEGMQKSINDYVELMKGKGISVNYDDVLKSFIDMSNKAEAIDKQTNIKMGQQRAEYAKQDQTMLLDMTANYLKYEEQRLAITSQYNAMRKKVENDSTLSDEQKQEMLTNLDNWQKDSLKNLSDGIADKIFDWKGIWGNAEKVSITSVRNIIKRLQDAAKTIGGGGTVSDEDKNILAEELGLTKKQVEDMLTNTKSLEEVTERFFSMYDSKMMNLSGNATQDVATFFNTFKDKCQKGMKSSDAFKESLKEMFTLENLGGLLQGISSVVSTISNGLKQIAEATDSAQMSDAAEVIGGIAQNFAAAGQGAATGGWIGAIVAGVTDAFGQAFQAITESIKGSKEVIRLAKAYKQELKEIRYEKEMSDNGDTIFGGSDYGNLVAALNALKDINGEIAKQQGLFSNLEGNIDSLTSLYDVEAAGKAADYFSQAWWGVADIFTFGIENAFKGKKQIEEFYKLISDEDKETIETLSNGRVEEFLKSVQETGNALGSMQIRVAKYGKNKWQTLADLAPDIWNEDGSVNTEALDAFLNTYGEKLTSEQKQLLESIKTDTEAYNQAIEQALSYYEGLFSGVGDNLMDSFVNSFKNGKDAMDDFTDSLEDNLEKWITDIARMAYIQPVLQEMQNMVENALKSGGDVDAAVEDALAYLYNNYGDMQEKTTSFLQEAKEKYDAAYGTDLFNDDTNPQADKGGLQSMSQDSADELNARFTALQLEGAHVVTAANALSDSVAALQYNSDRSVMLIQDIDRFQQMAYEQSQEHIDLVRAISDSVTAIAKDTARLKAIETNTNKL